MTTIEDATDRDAALCAVLTNRPTLEVIEIALSLIVRAVADMDTNTDPQWLEEILPLAECAKLRRVSVATLRREHKRGRLELIQVSAGRHGVRRRVALQLAG